MDINHIQLNPSALAGLYKNHLVESAESSTSPVIGKIPARHGNSDQTHTPVAHSIKALGSNNRQILILVNHPDVVFLPDEELRFLTGILAACKLTLADVAIVNLDQHTGTGYKELLSCFNSKQMLLFGLDPSSLGLPLHFPAFQLQSFNGTTYHWSPELIKIENDRGLKTQLWNNLKRMFNI